MSHGPHPQGKVILAIDQGTTGSTALLIDENLEVLGKSTVEFKQYYPKPSWVEHQPDEIWHSVGQAVTLALRNAKLTKDQVAAIGITNQRETTVLWDKDSGKPVYPAIVWQCRRTAKACEALKALGKESMVRAKTGLLLDPYFSASKVAWVLDEVEGARAKAEAGDLRFGTMDSYVLWKLSGGSIHVTDPSNASRTLLYNIHEGKWDEELLSLFRVPRSLLPDLRSSSEVYGLTHGLSFLPDGIPIAGIAGDQQAALFGQACFKLGDSKATYGTGAFVLMNTGERAVQSEKGLLTTVAWQLGAKDEGRPLVYALEGSVFIAGAAVQWLRDGLQVIDDAKEVESLARSVADTAGVTVVPTFSGLGAPYWDPMVRGAIMGLTRGTTKAHIARATLLGIAQQVADVLGAMEESSAQLLVGLPHERAIMVDGGAAANNLLMQMQSDLMDLAVVRPQFLDTTALGAAFLAGLALGIFKSQEEIAKKWREDRRFLPEMPEDERVEARFTWAEALGRLR